jgi:hypothetical protein
MIDGALPTIVDETLPSAGEMSETTQEPPLILDESRLSES